MKSLLRLGVRVALVITLTFSFWGTVLVRAATIPSFTASAGNSGYMLLNVTGDANSNIQLTFYPFGTSAATTIDLGTTDSNGNYSGTLSASQYSIIGGTNAYVTVNGMLSATIAWPSFSNGTNTSTSLSLNQYSASLNVGQSIVIYSANAALTSAMSSLAAVSVTVTNGQATITGAAAGSAVVTVCSSIGSCNTVSVTVQPRTSPLSLNQNYLTLAAGQGAIVISSNSSITTASSNSSAASAYVSNGQATIIGLSYGTATISVCNASSVCDSIYVSVQNPSGNTVVLSQNVVNVGVGETVVVYALNGSLATVSGNTPNASLSLNSTNSSNQVSITGVSTGTETVSVCASTTNCNVIYVTVQGSPVSNNLSLTQRTILLNIGQTTYVTSNSTTIVTALSDNTNVATVQVSYGKVNITAVTAGSATVTACDANNKCDKVYVTTLNPYNTPAPVSQPVAAVTPDTTVSTPAAPAVLVYKRLLTLGSVGADVRALQNQLINDGLLKGPATGRFEILTQKAVKRFQTRHSLPNVGYTGPGTRAALHAELAAGN